MYLLGVFWLVVATAALPVLPDPLTLSNSEHANHHSKIRRHVNMKNPITKCAHMCDPIEVEVPPNSSTLPCALPQDLEVPANIPCVETQPCAQISHPICEEEVKPNLGKCATGVVPAPPELPPFDYSILRKLVADLKQGCNEELRKPKLIEDCKPKPCGESNPLEEIKKEAVECSEDSPVTVQLKKPCGTCLNKLKANCSPSPCFG